MSDFPVKSSTRQRGPSAALSKWPQQEQQLMEMGFDIASVTDALNRSGGRMDLATALLCDLPVPKSSQAPLGVALPTSSAWGSTIISSPALWNTTGSSPSKESAQGGGGATSNHGMSAPSLSSPPLTKTEIAESKHRKFMSTFKVQRCREKVGD